MSDDISRILNTVPIESFLGKYVSLKRKGKNFWGNCPFHTEKSASFSVSPEKGIFKCFGCGVGGNVISFVQRYEKLSFSEALKVLADYAGITLSYHKKQDVSQPEKDHKSHLYKINEWVKNEYLKQLRESIEAKNYLIERGITPDTLQYFEIGYAPNSHRFLETRLQQAYKDNQVKIIDALNCCYELGLIDNKDSNNNYNRFKSRVIFPIYDIKGNICAFGGRITYKSDTVAKYVNSPESSIFSKKDTLYNLYHSREIIRKDGQIILVEGYLDVIGLYQKNIKNAVAPLGTSFTEEQAKLIKRYVDKVIIFFDADNAGIEASMRAMIIARKQKINIKVAIHNGIQGKDPFDLALALDDLDLLSLLDNAKDEIGFCVWYYFSHKFNITDITQKKKAIEELFIYIAENIEQNWEKLEYLNAVSTILTIPIETVKVDFKNFTQPNQLQKKTLFTLPNIKEEQDKANSHTSYVKPSIMEKNILVYLLRIPKLWNEDSLLEEIVWSSPEMELLFYFFKDRLLTGETWNWNELKEAMSILPNNLRDLLSEIIMKFEEDSGYENTTQENIDVKDLLLKMKKDIYNIKLMDINRQINNILPILKKQESMQENDQSLLDEIQYLLENKKKIQKQMEAISPHLTIEKNSTDKKSSLPFLEKMKRLSDTPDKSE